MTISFDESGNTGANLFDADQYVFTLASTTIDEEASTQLMKIFNGRIQGEYKYSKLKKAKQNNPLILDLLRDNLIQRKLRDRSFVAKSKSDVVPGIVLIARSLAHPST